MNVYYYYFLSVHTLFMLSFSFFFDIFAGNLDFRGFFADCFARDIYEYSHCRQVTIQRTGGGDSVHDVTTTFKEIGGRFNPFSLEVSQQGFDAVLLANLL